MAAQMANQSTGSSEKSWLRYLLPSLGDVIFIAIFAGVIVLGPRLMNMDGDLGRHLTIGGYILDSASIPTSDIFSHTMIGEHLTPHEWLAQVLFALAYRLGGLNGVVLLCAVVLGGTFTLLYRQAFLRSRLVLISLGLTVLAAAAASVHWLARPHIFTLLFTVLWVAELEKWRNGEKWRWWMLPVIMLLWVNTHGAYIIGILIWLVYLVGSYFSTIFSGKDGTHAWRIDSSRLKMLSSRQQLLLTGIPIVLVTLLNPAGWRVWTTTFGFLGNQYLVSHTVEYQAPDFQVRSFWPFLVMLCLSILLVGFSRRRLLIIDLFLLVAWTGFSLISARNIAVYAVIAAPILAAISTSVVQDEKAFTGVLAIDQRLRRVDVNLSGYVWPAVFAVVIALGVIVVSARADDGGRNRFYEQVFPVEAVNWMEDHPPTGQIFNYFPWGGYLLYRAWPEQLVFIDGQTDFYGDQLTRQYEQVITLSDDWNDVLEEYQVGRVLMPVDAKLIYELSTLEEWSVVYRDETAAVMDLSSQLQKGDN
jgi:hypothetical protein